MHIGPFLFKGYVEASANRQESCGEKLKKRTDDEKATELSYRVRYRMALAGEASTVAEILIKICAAEMATCAW